MEIVKPESIMTALLSDASSLVGDQDVVAKLASDNHVLEIALASAAEKIHELQECIDGFEKKEKRSISVELLAIKIEEEFKTGKIPLPSYFRNESNFTEVTCDPQNVYMRGSSIYAEVYFQSRDQRSGESLGFALQLMPVGDATKDAYYPGFHFGFKKAAPVAPAKKRVRARKAKVEVSTPPVDAASTGKEAFRKGLD